MRSTPTTAGKPHLAISTKKMACCCDCLGCTSAAYLAPELSSASAELPARVYYDALTLLLSGRALLPEPDPPRPGTLS